MVEKNLTCRYARVVPHNDHLWQHKAQNENEEPSENKQRPEGRILHRISRLYGVRRTRCTAGEGIQFWSPLITSDRRLLTLVPTDDMGKLQWHHYKFMRNLFVLP